MRTHFISEWARARHIRILVLPLISILFVQTGCECVPRRVSDEANPSLRAIEVPAGASGVDADRTKLARFIGVWSFRGTLTDGGGVTSEVAGSAAGVLENGHFVLLDVNASDGVFAGTAGRKSGSMLLGCEPGKGLTITAWGDGAPEVRRLIGSTNEDGSVFEFREVHGRVTVRIAFESDDRWTAAISPGSGSRRAMYIFSRIE